ncbi:hypothetical protein [Clostridium estertheticum]|uniref:hypothetical protein n=1 Tax=Clostridium estertheticum TaxID=238834 RepID=UPI001C7E0D8B|nr:hypothetical protein [Clostridium estertheticum]MBX4266146.1 hypothetical protein [Clostridium estertheticum]WLC87952.1 hypothetical protein KTC95_18255 [Clostridium estertheticum]
MNMKNKIYYIIISVSVILCMIIGFWVKNSFYNIVDSQNLEKEVSNYSVANLDDFVGKLYFDNNIKKFPELQKKSDLIVEIKLTANRKLYNQAILSEAEVLKTYKGKVKQGDKILIYEPVSFSNDFYYTASGYNFMRKNNSYIVFLKNLTIPKGYKYKNDEAKTYLPVSTVFAKYNIKYTNKEKILDKTRLSNEGKSNEIKYKDVKNNEIISTDVKTVDLYNYFKLNVLKTYKQ